MKNTTHAPNVCGLAIQTTTKTPPSLVALSVQNAAVMSAQRQNKKCLSLPVPQPLPLVQLPINFGSRHPMRLPLPILEYHPTQSSMSLLGVLVLYLLGFCLGGSLVLLWA